MNRSISKISNRPSNAAAWRHIADFLEIQHLASLGLKRVERKGPARGKAPREAHPVGNTGTTSQPAPLPIGAAMPLSLGFNHG